MTTQTEALKLALEGVEIHSPNSPEYIVCAALIQALAQTKHNPVGFYDAENKDLRREIPMGEDGDWWQPVYTTQPQRKPFTDAQVERLYRNIEPSRQQDARSLAAFNRLLRVIEAAHGITSKEKNI